MTLEERGAYITLLCHAWSDGSIPADVDEIGRIIGTTGARTTKIWSHVGPCFRAHATDAGRLVNPRMERERTKQAEHRASRVEAGRRGGQARVAKARSAQAQLEQGLGSAQDDGVAKSTSSSSSAFAIPTETASPPVGAEAEPTRSDAWNFATKLVADGVAVGVLAPHRGLDPRAEGYRELDDAEKLLAAYGLTAAEKRLGEYIAAAKAGKIRKPLSCRNMLDTWLWSNVFGEISVDAELDALDAKILAGGRA